MSEDQRAVRLDKLARAREMGISPYPDRFERTHTIARAAGLEEGTRGVRTAGRMVSRRGLGRLTFAHLQDLEGRLQIALREDIVGKEPYRFFHKVLDIGDILGVEGEIFRTKTGELTLNCTSFRLLGKAMLPLPEKWHGLADVEARYRQRYLDLIMSPETRERFRLRTRIVRAIRDFLDGHGFEEVETPVLQVKPSGAIATPFETHHEALDMPLYLRIAPETYLKRLIIGGYDKVYEYARCFRNEGMDPTHVQDFTMLEYYVAYWNYEDNMAFTEELLKEVLDRCFGSTRIKVLGADVDFGGTWPRIPLGQLIRDRCGVDVAEHPDEQSLRRAAEGRGIQVEVPVGCGRGKLIDAIFKKACRDAIVRPTFITAHPVELSPLARRNDADPRVVDRFQLLVGGWEVVNAYSELADPAEQRSRLEEQARLRAGGDEEAMVMDDDYLLAMEYGMPPVSGWGMGIDRLVCLLTGRENLRDVVLFPLLRPV